MTVVAVFIFLIISIILAFMKPKVSLFFAVFFVSWSGISIDIGLTFSAYVIFITPLCMLCIKRLVECPRYLCMIRFGILWLLIGYAIIWTLVLVPFIPDATIAGGWLRQPTVRSLTQIVMFLITISPLWIVPLLVRSSDDLVRIVEIYLVSVSILAIIGWLQLAIWVVTGSDPFPVNFLNDLLGGSGSLRSGVFKYMGGQIYRMSSFAGEPKGLSVALVVALLLLQAGLKAGRRYTSLLWIFLFFSLMATFSTMGILCWLCASVFQFFVTPYGTIRPYLQVQNFKKLIRWTGCILALLLILFISGRGVQFVDLIGMRTVDRIAQRDGGAFEEFNIAIFDFLVDKPLWAITGTGLGNAHLYADSYLPSYALRYASGTTYVAKSAVLRWISEIGIISLFIFLFWTLRNALKSVSLAHRVTPLSEIAAIGGRFFLPLMSFWIVSSYVTAEFYIAIGFFLSLGIIARTECNRNTRRFDISFSDFKR